MIERYEDLLPAAHVAPPAVLRDLRLLHPGAGLLYLGEGVFALGLLRPRWELADGGLARREAGRKILDREWRKAKPDWARLRQGRMLMAGASIIDLVPPSALESGWVVGYFAMLDWVYRTGAEAAFEDRLDEAEGIPGRQAALRWAAEYGRHEGRSIYAHAFRGRRSFASPGLNN